MWPYAETHYATDALQLGIQLNLLDLNAPDVK